MLVADVLKNKGSTVFMLRTTDTVMAAAHRLSEHRVGALVVEDTRLHPCGIFSERDLVNAVARHGSAALEWSVKSFMSTPLITCKPSDRVDAALAVITLRKIRHLPVMDGDRLIGLVSIGDLVKQRLDEKELESNVLREIARLRT